VTAAVHVVSGSTHHRPFKEGPPELRWNGHQVLLAGDGVAHSYLCLHQRVFDEDTTVAAIEDTLVAEDVESLRRYAVGSVKHGGEHGPLAAAYEGAEERQLPMVCIELLVKLGVGDEAPPALADGGGAG